MSAYSQFATVPKLSSGRNLPRNHGQTRNNGRLEYLNPMTDAWVPAFRLQDVRQRLLHETRQGNARYAFPKANGDKNGRDPTNYTSFLLQDQPYGSSRPHRNPILFKIHPTDGGRKPTGYVTYRGRILLDSYDHGIRDFGDALPICISTAIEGRDIETYLRRNREITYYDILARMPNSYLTGNGQNVHNGPPRVGTLSMRATRFRLLSACLAWTEKKDTKPKNQMMLSIIPQDCQVANSTWAFRDLTKKEQDRCATGKGKNPEKGRNKYRPTAYDEDEDESGDEDTVDEENEDDNVGGELPTGDPALEREGSSTYPDNNQTITNQGVPSSMKPRALKNVDRRGFQSSNKRRRVEDEDEDEDAGDEEEIGGPVAKRQRIEEDGSSASGSEYLPNVYFQRFKSIASKGKQPQAQSAPVLDPSFIARYSVAIGSSRNYATFSKDPSLRNKHVQEELLDFTGPLGPGFEGTSLDLAQRNENQSDNLSAATISDEEDMSDDRDDNNGFDRDLQAWAPDVFGPSEDAIVENVEGTGISTANTGLGLTFKDNLDHESTGTNSTHSRNGSTISDGENANASKPKFVYPDKDDFRYIIPDSLWTGIEDAKMVQKALGLSLIDFFQKTKALPRMEFCQGKTYADQWHILNNAFQARLGEREGSPLYCLPVWHEDFQALKGSLDRRGQELWRLSDRKESL